MPITQVQNSKANVKKLTTNDQPFAPAQPVANLYTGVSTAGQNAIPNLGFSVDTTTPANFLLIVDGKILTQGTSNDYTFSGIAADGTSSSIALNTTLPAGLNIQAIKLGLKKESEFLTDNRFTSLYEAQQNGFQAFVNNTTLINATTTTGTPVAGTFYSSITGRAQITDFTQDLKPRMGIDRIYTQEIFPLQGEIGPNGEIVFGSAGDTLNQIRFIGNAWYNLNDSNGVRPVLANATAQTTDALEITFYGTALNVLALWSATGQTYSVSVDGAAPVTLTVGAYTTTLNSRGYAPLETMNVIKGLTLGVHTIRIAKNTSAVDFNVYGFEIINESSNIVTNPGVAYNSGKKIQLATQSSIGYAANATGTRGGRVLHYLNASGAIAQAWTPVNAAAAYMTAADHTNEELVRQIEWREFGAYRSDDYQTLGSGNRPSSFTLDDGSTTLSSINAVVDTNIDPNYKGLSVTGGSSYTMFLSFVGTGLDLVVGVSGTGFTRTMSYYLDGSATAVGTTSYTTSSPVQVIKIASGLPYGSHTLKILCTSSSNSPGLFGFNVFQPKKPVLPAGAVELGDYNVLATYVAGTTDATVLGSQGTLLKNPSREMITSGTWSIGQNTVNSNGWQLSSGASGSFLEYTFFGTGLEILATWNASNATTATIMIDGVLYTGTATISNGANGSWTAGTGTFTVSAGSGTNLQIQGLALGIHRVRITQSNAYSFIVNGIAVITPIHANKSNSTLGYQTGGTIGSQAISDNRKVSATKDGITVKAAAVAFGQAANPTTTASNTTPIPCPDMGLIVKTSGGQLDIDFYGDFNNSTSGAGTNFAIAVDGQFVGPAPTTGDINAPGAGINFMVTRKALVNVAPGIHFVQVFWGVYSGTLGAYSTSRCLIVKER